MAQVTAGADPARSAVFAPLSDLGRAELVERRLQDAITSGVLHDGERLPSESQLGRRLGVAVVTAREALEALRDAGLIQTRRGRDGGSFVTFDPETALRFTNERIRSISSVELRDASTHYSAIAGMAAELAADRAGEEDVQGLRELEDQADLSTEGGARRAVARFQLEVAALSQSPRLVREELRLQAEIGSLIWMGMRAEDQRIRSAEARRAEIDAIRDADIAAARRIAVLRIADGVEWLLDEKTRLEVAAESAVQTVPSLP
ncbi:FadR/GntR family transcriptional regulator [Microbacterium panaciterrae]|uniref:HTH gntR-type domain-containing protein n=1 Tax=Microbacterium panaciterrae TaxID=985759 RepID=A0ABP8PA89_9MICO